MSDIYTQNIRNLFENEIGYSNLKIFNNEESIYIKNIINKLYVLRLNKFIKLDNLDTKIENYHKLNITDKEHNEIWGRSNRKSNKELAGAIRRTNIYNNLKKQLSDLNFSYVVDRNINNEPDIYWRLVRPNKKNDVGPIHADSWFWKLNDYPLPENFKTFKVWVMLSEGTINSGFQLIEGSHQNKEKWSYTSLKKDNTIKPIFDYKKNNYNLLTLKTSFGEGVIFHEDLLHSGKLNTFDETRVSIEFTLTFRYK